ncbi:kinesin-like protein KIF3A [Sitophilus oryzae]|uniref:Kinesin-like protein n=1 Tax=Sitophilus oryzae TaxID=7048 RepID=A0A6J2XXH0_SITOR|nr:kinesin-like protein KIF3A [Sitophilus oryzae]XP_030756164.1 kinesin-like protein KIF3A [Sitophilus oryzae]XP_030756165.1 kinesin-like protein KIF3A [Sitophilus oryzae]XP_030756166.1 kinesin-like protein KIF3A [Sitophilus oryzae]
MEENHPRGANNVRVYVRIRPFNEREVKEGNKGIIVCDYEENVVLLKKPPEKCTGKDLDNKYFKLDYIFSPTSAQLDVYRIVAAPLVEQVFDGYNATIFAYGQTGTGKTFTMTGNYQVSELRGIIPNTFTHIFTQIANSSEDRSFIVKVMYLEIYNEEVRDLLGSDPNKKLQIKERKDIGIYVKDLSGFTVDSVESITQLMDRGNKNRITRSTMMNNVSSRSHAIFTIVVESKNRHTNKTTVGKLNLVDLAGSERIKKTGVTGEGLREAGNINQSLSTLSNVIQALVEGKSFVPYRNSKLTRLLQDSLGGNSKTSMIAMVSPAEQDYEESHSTLRYAHKAKYIKNYAKINVEESGLIEHFEQEIAELQQKLSLLTMVSEQPKSRKKAKSELDVEKIKKAEAEMERIEHEKRELEDRLSIIQKKIICGGENLLEKAQQQEFLLLTSGQELENLDRSHQQLEEQYNRMTEEKIDIEEKYSSLQEEDGALNKKIKVVQERIKEAKEEYADKEHEYQRDMEGLNDNNRLLVREMQLSNLMIDYYIPAEYKKVIQQYCIFNNDTQEYQLQGVAYTGNNMRKRQMASEEAPAVKFEMKQVYHKYPDKKKVTSKRSLLKAYSAVPKQTR